MKSENPFGVFPHDVNGTVYVVDGHVVSTLCDSVDVGAGVGVTDTEVNDDVALLETYVLVMVADFPDMCSVARPSPPAEEPTAPCFLRSIPR